MRWPTTPVSGTGHNVIPKPAPLSFPIWVASPNPECLEDGGNIQQPRYNRRKIKPWLARCLPACNWPTFCDLPLLSNRKNDQYLQKTRLHERKISRTSKTALLHSESDIFDTWNKCCARPQRQVNSWKGLHTDELDLHSTRRMVPTLHQFFYIPWHASEHAMNPFLFILMSSSML